VDLGLDDDDRAARLGRELLRGLLRLVDREGGVALRDGDAVALEDLLGLILVDLQRDASGGRDGSISDDG
jgi:hypothetical protein